MRTHAALLRSSSFLLARPATQKHAQPQRATRATLPALRNLSSAETVLALQRTIGNKATVATVQRAPGVGDPLPETTGVTWSSPTWVSPSSEGAMGGVILVTVGGNTFALKAASTDAGAVVFGERALKKIGGSAIVTPDSIPVKSGSVEFTNILTMLRDAEAMVAKDKLDNYRNKRANLTNAKYILVQKGLNPVKLTEETEKDPASVLPTKQVEGTKLTDEQAESRKLMMRRLFNMGRTLAGDLFIGNADRLDQINPGNIFLERDAAIGTIDTQAVLQSISSSKPNDIQRWTEMLIWGGVQESEEGVIGLGLPSSMAARAADFDRWFDTVFRYYFFEKMRERVPEVAHVKGFLNNEERAHVEKAMEVFDWPAIKEEVRQGFNSGLGEIARILSSRRGRQEMKKGLQSAEAAYGRSKNLDWHALKVKGSYMAAVHAGANADEAMARASKIAEYLAGWKPAVASSVSALSREADESFDQVPKLPPDMPFTQKLRRFFTPRTAAEKRAAQLKKGLRSGAVDPKAVDMKNYSDGGRRTDKAFFELKYRNLMNAFTDRLDTMSKLRRTFDTTKSESDVEIAVRKRNTMRRLWTRSAEPLLIAENTYEDIASLWKLHLPGKQGSRYAEQIMSASARMHATYTDLDTQLKQK